MPKKSLPFMLTYTILDLCKFIDFSMRTLRKTRRMAPRKIKTTTGQNFIKTSKYIVMLG